MRELLLSAKWEYDITKTEADGYGYRLRLYKDNECIHDQSGYGAESIAYNDARRRMLIDEFDVWPE